MNQTESMKAIEAHWKEMAEKNRENLSATTKCSTIKKLEINELERAIEKIRSIKNTCRRVLEVGCGNGYNLIALQKKFPMLSFTGVDYIPEMIESAKKLSEQEGAADIEFYAGNILELAENRDLANDYDVVFTDRCLINLPTTECQAEGMRQLCQKVGDNGHLILIENFIETYHKQNLYRTFLGLDQRTPDSYNRFLSTEIIPQYLKTCGLTVCEIRDFGSLHDLMLYVLLPKLNGGKIDYHHPMMDAVTELSIAASRSDQYDFGSMGQNRLYLLQKEGRQQ